MYMLVVMTSSVKVQLTDELLMISDTVSGRTPGYFLPDKPSSVPESNPNSEDESESEDRSVAKKGRKYCFR